MFALVLIVLYLLLLLGIGRLAWVGQRQHTASDYFVAGRTLGPFLLVMSIFGTTMTSFALLGSSGEAWREGIGVYGLMASWSGIIHSACFFLIGVKLWRLGKEYGYTTQIQFFRDRFQSPTVGLLLFPLIVGLVIVYIIVNIIGAGDTISVVTKGALPQVFPGNPQMPGTVGAVPWQVGSAAVCLVVLVYVFGGGARSTAWANVAQTLAFMFIGLLTLVLIAGKLGGADAASQAVAQQRPDLLVRGAAEGRAGNFSHLHFLTYAFIPLSVAMFPHLFQNWMTARSAKAFRATVMLHPIFILIVWAPCILLGIWASSAMIDGQAVVPATLKNQNLVLSTMVERLTNPVLGGFIAVGILASSMALDSQFLALATMFTKDVVMHYRQQPLSDGTQIQLARAFVLVMVVIAYAVSLVVPRSVFTLGVWCFSGFSALFPLVFASLYWRRTTKAGAIASILAALVAWVLLLSQARWGADRDYLFLGMMPVATIVVVAAVTLVVVSLLTRPPTDEVLERFFPRVKVPQATPAQEQAVADLAVR